MAKNDALETAAEDTRAALEAQLADLKVEIAKINETLSAKAGEFADSASEWADDASSRASRAAQVLKGHAHDVSETVKANPGTVSSALALGGVVGLIIGLLLGQSGSRSRW